MRIYLSSSVLILNHISDFLIRTIAICLVLKSKVINSKLSENIIKSRAYVCKVALLDNHCHLLLPLVLADENESHRQQTTPKK